MTSADIKAAYSMRDIVERYGFHLNRAGFIPCPFHQGDRTPSLKVYDRDFHCHACGAHGDIFDFIQKIAEVSFQEAFVELGGTHEPNSASRKMVAMRIARVRQAKAEKEEKEREFRKWRMPRLAQVCRVLRMLDELLVSYEPLSDDWEAAMELYIRNAYRYAVLTAGTREEQEEMRALNE